MKYFKFRYKDADGKYHYKTVTLPNDAAIRVAFDDNGKEVYDDDILIGSDGCEWLVSNLVTVEMAIGGVYEFFNNPRTSYIVKEQTS